MKGALATLAFLAVLTCSPSLWSRTEPTPHEIARLTVAAENGDAKSQYQLGYDHVWGFGFRKDAVKAVQWLRRSANQGYAPAELLLGSAYDEGTGVHQDDNEAITWYQRAADQNYALAKFMLATKYEFARNGLSRDHDKAEQLWKESVEPLSVEAEKGEVLAQCDLGLAYLYGWGIKKDNTEGFKWLRKAAEQGHPMGEGVLGIAYHAGWGDVPPNDDEAVKWLQKAAEQNVHEAQYVLGMAYATGKGVPRDYVKAYMWLDLAVAQRNKEAGSALVELAKNMTSGQVKEATKLTHAWQEKRQ